MLSESQCNACSSFEVECPQYFDLLSCALAWNGPCQNQQACESTGGINFSIMVISITFSFLPYR